MNNLEKMRRHLAQPVKIAIKNKSGEEDEFMLKPLNIKQQFQAVELGKSLENSKTDVNGNPDISREEVSLMIDLLSDVIKASMPDIDDETVFEFVSNNFEQLMMSLEKLMPENKEKAKTELIKDRIDMTRNATKKE